MKTIQVILLSLVAGLVHAQGTFVFDQQSSDESNIREGGTGLGYQPLGQSFTPSLSSVGFIRIFLFDGWPPNQTPGTLRINLLEGSITGPVLGSADLTLPARFSGPVDFVFPTAIAVTPGTTYYFQPLFVSGGGGWGVNTTQNYGYSGGNAFIEGIAYPSWDLWFREGVIIPEPSGGWLLLLGGCALAVNRRNRAVQSAVACGRCSGESRI